MSDVRFWVRIQTNPLLPFSLFLFVSGIPRGSPQAQTLSKHRESLSFETHHPWLPLLQHLQLLVISMEISATPALTSPPNLTTIPSLAVPATPLQIKTFNYRFHGTPKEGWQKKWYGAGIFYEGAEEVEVDVFKKLEKQKVLSKVEKAGLLTKAEELGLTLTSIEKLGLLSKAEELGLLSLLEKAAGFSPSALASAALPILVAAVAAIVLIPDDSGALVAVQAVVAGTLGAGAAGLLVGSVVLDGLQEAD
ncbi:Protein of unknown function D [Prunus dulcis]|uniref:Transmembrane protein n=1 Tax=Prunus dulcis TaxID=3755 RepID=A0A4Y1RIH8_PRUDU|nr:Protein of unknown function D [Prunus dulcis]